MLMGRRPLTFYDQISTGLDSAATFDICRRITGVAKNLHTTPIVALLQPPPETYNLFDEILILALGYIVYHGPREEVLPYFSSIGFDCPYDRDIADFIQEVTTPARKKYQTRADAPQDEEAMAKAWEASPYSQAKRDAVAVRCNTDNKVDGLTRRELFAKDKPKYANSLFTELKLVLKRQNQLVYRDPAFVRARIMQSVIMGVVIGTIFLRIDPNLPDSNAAGDFTPITQRYGVTFATLMQCALAGMAQVPVVLGQRPVYYKQTNSYFFRTVSYVFAEFVTVIPVAVVESVILGALVFWITAIVPWGEDSQTGESDVGSRFMIFLCIMIAINVSFAAYLRAVTTMVPSASIGQVVAGISISASVVYSGFIIVQSAMPPWFIWIYWLSPIAWAYRSAVLTIFTSSAFTDEQSAFALDLFGFPSNKQYIWAGILMLIAYVIVDVGLSMFGYTHVRYESGGGRQTKSNPDAEPNDNPDVVEVERVMQERSSEMRSASELAAARASTAPGQSALRMQTSLQNENFTPVDLVFRDLWYSVQAPGDKSGYNLDLLKGISGYAEAGTLTALMGSSGAGKTTLMDVLALRKTAGKTKGEVLVNGRPQEKTTFSRIIGYVEQNDIHSPSATVVEALT
ncbi:ABC transporter G family member 31, partial [Hondaea fermentalgiana]